MRKHTVERVTDANTQSRPIVQASREVRSHCLRVQWEGSGFLFEGWRGFGDATVVVSFFFSSSSSSSSVYFCFCPPSQLGRRAQRVVYGQDSSGRAMLYEPAAGRLWCVSDSGEREGGRASYRCSFGWGLLFFLSI